MCLINSIKAQTTFTVSALKADSAKIAYTKSDSISAGTVRTDTLCSAKDLCVHQDAKISGNVEVTGKVVAKSGILLDTNNVGIYKMYLSLPSVDSTQTTAKTMGVIFAGPLGNGTAPPIDYDPCESGQIVDTAQKQQGGGGFIAGSIRGNAVDATIGMWSDWWTGNGMIDVMGLGLPGHGLYLNYMCGKDVYIGTGFGPGGTWQSKAGSKIYCGDYVEMRKKLQIGSPQWGTPNDPNNIALEVHSNSGTGIRVKTYTINDPMLSVFNSNTGSSSPLYAYNGRNTFAVYGDGKVKIRSFENSVPIVSIGKYNTASNTDAGTEYFRMYADGRTVWQSSGANVQVLTLNNGSNDVLRVFGDGRVYIGQQVPLVGGVHQDAMLSIDGKVIAKKFYVTTKPGVWGDDEFDKKLLLDSLTNEIKYAMKNKHLVGIKGAKEIEAEGIEVNEIISVLVRKIERLYIYLYMLQEENKKLKEKIEGK